MILGEYNKLYADVGICTDIRQKEIHFMCTSKMVK